eukprot:CAMPEP_0173241834 /NCGR_PEP_ID=MMETSP1142-20121109/14597_1 /TAXON_ID=483371 /ORGANISM="non described non described, Strain CCMP2298" /LENGTH=256 /DNA_ID=CAMNT_0014173221 /DNA_START=47 /DNA_END=814 /DNA_ORIENTATION=+
MAATPPSSTSHTSSTSSTPTSHTSPTPNPFGLTLMDAFILKCAPIEAEAATRDDWSAQQAAASPTLLPHLRFHDLVFGRVLGEGAFSCVKYARRITRDKAQAGWADYAVKVVQAARIRELGYAPSVAREMAVLQVLSHPGVARLISAFRYHDSAYLVLEYASKGDLHTYLLRYGKLSHLRTRFVLGEVAAGVGSVHDMGFSFGDLKPENVLVTEMGHIKITDFGACRPVTPEASQVLRDSGALLDSIRNGDWKEET